MSLWQRFDQIAAGLEDKIAVTQGSTQLSFAALHARATALSAHVPAKAGDRVILCGENSPELIALVVAIWRRGGIVTMLHADAPMRHLEHAIAVTQPTACYFDDPARVADLKGHLIGAELAATAPPAPVQRGADQPGSIIFTSGSTGLPKGVTQTAANLMDGATRVGALLGYGAEDSILCPIPFAFDYGWGQLLSLVLEGIPLILPEPRNGFGLCAALSAHRPTVLAGVPAVFSDLLSGLAPIAETDCTSVRLITNTGSKIPPQVFRTLLETFAQAEVSLNYGLTETYRSASLPFDLAQSHPTSVGLALPGVVLDVIRPDGSPAEPEEEGEILHRGAGAFLEYWGDPVATAQVRRVADDGTVSVHTGDLGHKDVEGRLYIHGRRDAQMKSMGVRVSPDEVENILHESGLLREVAVLARPHDVLGDMIVACVVIKDAPEKEALKQIKRHARAQMSQYMQPREYIVMETLPRTTSGKVAYATLRAEI